VGFDAVTCFTVDEPVEVRCGIAMDCHVAFGASQLSLEVAV